MNDNSEKNPSQDGSEMPSQWQWPLKYNEQIFQEVRRKSREERIRNRGPHPDYFSLTDPDLEDQARVLPHL